MKAAATGVLELDDRHIRETGHTLRIPQSKNRTLASLSGR